MLIRTSIFLLTFLAIQSFVFAGGSHYPAKIESIRTDETKFYLSAVFIDAFGYDASQCKTITVSGCYDDEKWRSYTKLINEDIHLQSLELLKVAHNEGTIINLGFIGAGYKKVGNCEYLSKGLFHEEQGVFSIYTRI